jgi:hypothetical protein
MAKVGRFVTDHAGMFCQIKLDSRERILVGHVGRGFSDGSITIEVLKFLRFTADSIFACDLESPQGKAVLTRLTTALGSFVAHLRTCKSVADVKAKCAAWESIT